MSASEERERERPRSSPPGSGLCPRCAHVRSIRSERGSVFLQCKLSKRDPSFPRYPPQPRLACRGFED